MTDLLFVCCLFSILLDLSICFDIVAFSSHIHVSFERSIYCFFMGYLYFQMIFCFRVLNNNDPTYLLLSSMIEMENGQKYIVIMNCK